MTVEAPLEAARRSGLVASGEPLVVMLSGGADSTCLLDVALRLGAHVRALHVDHGLRPDSEEDARHCGELCERLGVTLDVERARLPGTGNVQAQAREARYALAGRLGAELGADHAAAHTLSDQAETVVYRLATSPGPRALLGMAPRRGHLVRPLLEVPGSATRAWCRENGLAWREDPSNADPRYARARVRAEVMPVLLDLSPAAERTIAQTARLLREDAEVLEAAAAEALGGPGVAAVSAAELDAQPRALRRLALRRLAAETSPGSVALSDEQVERVLALAQRRGGTASLDVGGGLRALVEYGMVRFSAAARPVVSEPVLLPVPGRVAFGEWEVEARRETDPHAAPAGEALLDADALGGAVTVRARRDGDRLRPAGVGGTKSLQDLFTDSKVPRELRATLPVVEVGGEIAWVAGLAVGERFRAVRGAERVVTLAARRGPTADSRPS